MHFYYFLPPKIRASFSQMRPDENEEGKVACYGSDNRAFRKLPRNWADFGGLFAPAPSFLGPQFETLAVLGSTNHIRPALLEVRKILRTEVIGISSTK